MKSVFTFYFILTLVALLAQSGPCYGQSSQYQRKKEVKTPEKGEETPAQTEKPEGDQLDISDLEKKYWAPKDTDFSVVQNRTYKKEQRFSGTLLGGPIINDSYSKGINFNLSGNYFLSERIGVELSYLHYNLGDNVLTSEFINRYGAFPDHNKARRFVGAAFNWVPIYAKVSLLGSKILYFDMAVSPGVGLTFYDQIASGGNQSKSSVTLTLDFTQMFFLSTNFAVRIDLKNHLYQEQVLNYTRGTYSKDQSVHNFLLLFGLTYFH